MIDKSHGAGVDAARETHGFMREVSSWSGWDLAEGGAEAPEIPESEERISGEDCCRWVDRRWWACAG